MYVRAQTVDDLLRGALTKLLSSKLTVGAKRGPCLERTGALLRLENPLARVSVTESRSKVISALGELLWYLRGSDSLQEIEYYIEQYRSESSDGTTVYGAYGPRIFAQRGVNQLANVIQTLRGGEETRRAVIQLFDADDITCRRQTIPCTCSLQFLVRNKRLHLVVFMRSNDAWLGLCHDLFCFTMLQEFVARLLGIRLGHYHHHVGSLHLYTRHVARAERFLAEGWQEKAQMPPMPRNGALEGMLLLQEVEASLRGGFGWDPSNVVTNDYWKDLMRLLESYAVTKHPAQQNTSAAIARVRKQMASPFYDFLLSARARSSQGKTDAHTEQLKLNFDA